MNYKFVTSAVIVGPQQDVKPIHMEILKCRELRPDVLRQTTILCPGTSILLGGAAYYEEASDDYPDVFWVFQEHMARKALGSALVYLLWGKGPEAPDNTRIQTPLFTAEGRTCESLRILFENECKKRYHFDISTQHKLYTRAEFESSLTL